MSLVLYHLLAICLLFLHTNALNCRSEGGPKEWELKNIYNKCLQMQDGKNNSHPEDQDRREPGRRNQRNDWDSDPMGGRNKNSGSRNKNDKRSGMGYDEGMGGYGDSSNYDRNNDDRMNRGRYGGSDREDSMSGRGNSYGRDSSRGGRGNYQHDDYGDMQNQYGYQSSTQSSKRYKRDRWTENSGQRSQFNPNTKRPSHDDSYQTDDKGSKDNNTKDEEKKACALHCFLENLEMTAEDGMPDRYLVTHSLTKDVTNEDLKDFLQESIEECFQILDNENSENKCEFSKNLLMCLSEKGRANCDDWKDDLRF